MKRDEVKQKIPGITEEQLNWLMDENGRDVTAEKSRATSLQGQVDTLSAQLKTAQDGLKAFDGVDVQELQNKITKLTADMAAQADAYAFDSALDGAIRDAKGRSVKAIRGMLDLDTLRSSKDRSSDIAAALTALAKENAWAFEGSENPDAGGGTGAEVNTGGEHGSGGSAGDHDGVMAAFQALNPGLKI